MPGTKQGSASTCATSRTTRTAAAFELCALLAALALRRNVSFQIGEEEHHPAVPADALLVELLSEAVASSGNTPHRLPSGQRRAMDAAVMATVCPLGHMRAVHPEPRRAQAIVRRRPRVLNEDVQVAPEVMLHYTSKSWPITTCPKTDSP